MIKVARKPSADPVQEKLRQNKALWNKEVSSFINDLIHLKKTMNGWPSKFYQEKSKIILPIPANPGEILSNLAGQFEKLTQHGNSIVQEQINYSKNRKLPRPQQAVNTLNKLEEKYGPTEAPVPSPLESPLPPDAAALTQKLSAAETNLVKLASRLESKYDLVSEASNPVTRFFAKLFNPKWGFGEAARIRRARMEMLNACARVYKKLEKLQVEIVRSSDESIDSAWSIFNDDVWKNWNTVRTGFKAFKGLRPQGVPNSGGPIKTPQEIEEARKKQQQEAEKVENKMDQIDQAEQAGKPDPEDAAYQPGQDETGPASWEAGYGELIKHTGGAEKQKLAQLYLNDYIKNWQKISPFLAGLADYTIFENLRTVYEQYDHWVDKNAANYAVIRSYKELLSNLNRLLGTSSSSIGEIVKTKEAERAAQIKARDEAIKAQDAAFKAQQKGLLAAPPPAQPAQPPKKASAQLEVIAQDFLKKWVGKKRHQMSLFDDTSNVRLQIFELAEEARKVLDQIMNHLEKDLKIEEMDPLVQKVNLQLESLRGMMVNLHQLRTVQKKRNK